MVVICKRICESVLKWFRFCPLADRSLE